MDSINPKLIVITLLVAALLIISAIALLRRRRMRRADRSGYIAALYALIDLRKDDALRLLTRAVRNGEDDADAYILLGNLLREMKQHEKALQIHRGLTVRPDLTQRQETATRIAIAEDLSELGRIDNAVGMLEALAGARKDPDILESLHRLQHRRGEYDAAYAALHDLARISDRAAPADRAAYLTAVACRLIDTGHDEEAKKYLEKSRRDDRNAPATICLSAGLAMASRDLRQAIRLWEQLLTTDISYFQEVAPNLEKALFESSRFEELERILVSLLEAHPSHPLALSRLARFHAKKGDVDRGIDLLEAERENVARDPILAATLAALYLQSDRPAEALSILEAADGLSNMSTEWRCDSCGEICPVELNFCSACWRYGTIHRHEDTDS